MSSLLASDRQMLVWWGTEVECASALARRERERSIASDQLLAASVKLDDLVVGWREIPPTEHVRRTARRLVNVHPLRAADAYQLAAALAAAEEDPSTLEFVTLDERLADAARREGFRLLP